MTRWNLFLPGGLLLILFTGNAFARQAVAPLPKPKHKIIVIAHRGDHVNVPENTLASYRQAIVAGADYVEVDLRTARDGHLVVMHDATVNRMTNGKGAVADLTYRQIKQLEIHPVKKSDTVTYRMPDFASVLKLCKGRINIYLDFKEADVEKTYSLIKRMDMEKQVVVYLNKEEQYGQWKKVAPKMPLMASLPDEMSLQQLDSLLNKRKINIVDNAYDEERIRFLHHKGIAIWTDVESEGEGPAIWRKMLAKGVDGLQTDHPEKLIKYLIRINRR